MFNFKEAHKGKLFILTRWKKFITIKKVYYETVYRETILKETQ